MWNRTHHNCAGLYIKIIANVTCSPPLNITDLQVWVYMFFVGELCPFPHCILACHCSYYCVKDHQYYIVSQDQPIFISSYYIRTTILYYHLLWTCCCLSCCVSVLQCVSVLHRLDMSFLWFCACASSCHVWNLHLASRWLVPQGGNLTS